MDGRAKPGHDTVATIVPVSRQVSAYADEPGHDGEATACAAKICSNRRLVLIAETRPAMRRKQLA
jgi:hypothetical protein